MCLFVLLCFFFHLVVLFFFFFKKAKRTETPILANVGLAKVGNPNFGQSRSIKVGQSLSIFCWLKSVWPKSDWPKVGQLRMAKVGLAKVGLSLPLAKVGRNGLQHGLISLGQKAGQKWCGPKSGLGQKWSDLERAKSRRAKSGHCRDPHPSGPDFSGFGPHLWSHDTHQIQKWIGQKWIGQSRSLPWDLGFGVWGLGFRVKWFWMKLDFHEYGFG